MSDEEILAGLLAGGESEETALRVMYINMLPMVIQHVIHNNGTKEDAQDVFQDALITFAEQVKRGSFQRRSAISTYVNAIARNIWNNRLRRQGYGDRYVSEMKPLLEDERFPAPDTPSPLWMEKELEKVVAILLSKLGEKCQEILRKRFWDGFKMEKIAELMQYKNGQIAKNKHFRCLEELRALVANDLSLRNHLRGLL